MKAAARILVAGEGGQGVQSIADILAHAAFLQGKEALYIPNFGIEQRGGVSLAFVQIADVPIGSPKFARGDLVMALSERAIERTRQYVSREETLFVFDSSLIQPPEVVDRAVGWQVYDTAAPEFQAREESQLKKESFASLPSAKRIMGIPAADVARRELHPRVLNMVVLGAAVALTEVVREDCIIDALERKLRDKFVKKPELKDLNHRALQKGRDLAIKRE